MSTDGITNQNQETQVNPPPTAAQPVNPFTIEPPVRTPPPPTPAASATDKEKHPRPGGTSREIAETVVFVVVLVLLLKSFVAEAFVIPTGSMATTLLGYHRHAKCNQCGHDFLVNASDEVEQQNIIRRRGPVTHGICPNCGNTVRLDPNNGVDGGDKVLVFKPSYDMGKPQSLDVIVFKFPGGPQELFTAKNYIKRLWGLPGDKLAIWYGDVYRRVSENGAEKLMIIRKPPGKMLEMRRIVFDNDHHPADLKHLPPRWSEDPSSNAWKATDDNRTLSATGGEQASWIRYSHLFWFRNKENKEEPPPEKVRPQLICDVLGYNTADSPTNVVTGNWIGDLMFDFEVDVQETKGELILELNCGVDTHHAIFDLSNGTCTLKVQREGQPVANHSAPTPIGKTGKHRVRFANFDQRLTVWVDGKLPFGEGFEFAGPTGPQKGPRVADLKPAAIGVRNTNVQIRHLQLWRDLYYTQTTSFTGSDFPGLPGGFTGMAEKLSLTDAEEKTYAGKPFARPTKWMDSYYDQLPKHYDVKADEYFALGDNSTHSSDSRVWEGVPDKLLLGKAVFVYWPWNRFGPIW